jgi:hypothetical protein
MYVDEFSEIIKYSQSAQEKLNYNTVDFSIYLHGFIRMFKPACVLELGTALGVTSFLSALACKENNYGKVITIDDSSHHIDQLFENLKYEQYIDKKINDFKLNKFIEFKKYTLNHNSFPLFLNDLNVPEIGIVFNDFDEDPFYILMTIIWMLPRVNKEAYLITDGAALNWWPHCYTELLMNQLKNGKIPKDLADMVDEESLQKLYLLLQRFNFSHMEFIKHKCEHQNNFTIIKIYENYI